MPKSFSLHFSEKEKYFEKLHCTQDALNNLETICHIWVWVKQPQNGRSLIYNFLYISKNGFAYLNSCGTKCVTLYSNNKRYRFKLRQKGPTVSQLHVFIFKL